MLTLIEGERIVSHVLKSKDPGEMRKLGNKLFDRQCSQEGKK